MPHRYSSSNLHLLLPAHTELEKGEHLLQVHILQTAAKSTEVASRADGVDGKPARRQHAGGEGEEEEEATQSAMDSWDEAYGQYGDLDEAYSGENRKRIRGDEALVGQGESARALTERRRGSASTELEIVAAAETTLTVLGHS